MAAWRGLEATAEAEFDAQGSLYYRPVGSSQNSLYMHLEARYTDLWSVVYICKDTKNDHVFCRIAGALPSLDLARRVPPFASRMA